MHCTEQCFEYSNEKETFDLYPGSRENGHMWSANKCYINSYYKYVQYLKALSKTVNIKTTPFWHSAKYVTNVNDKR